MYAPSNTLPQKYLYLPKTPPLFLKILISQRPPVWRKSFPSSDLLRWLILFLVEFWIVFKRTFYRKIYPFWKKSSTLLWMLNDLKHERHKENRLQEICGGLVDNDTWNFCCIICPLYQQSVTNIVPAPRPGSPLFGSIKDPFQGFSFFLWTNMRTKTIQKRFPLRGSYSPKGPAFFIYLNYYLHMTHSFQILIFMIVKD